MAVLIVLTIVHMMLLRWSGDNAMSPGKNVLFVYYSFLGQSDKSTLRLPSLKIRYIIGLFTLASFILSKAYSGALISFLTIPLISAPMDTIYELAKVRSR